VPYNDKTVIALDFDGVIHDYKGKNFEPDFPTPAGEPVAGAHGTVLWLLENDYELVISSGRVLDHERGADAISKWLEKWNFPAIRISKEKPIAHLYVDDRGFRFNGPESFVDLQILLTKQPIPGRWRKT